MKVIKYWKVQLLQLFQPSGKLPGIINAHNLVESLLFEGYSKDKPKINLGSGVNIELFTAPDSLETRIFRDHLVDSVRCFPVFEYDDETERYYAVHHPFTRPKDSDIDKIENDPANCLADAYDIVLNGFELGGGSQRIYEQELQERAFRALGFTQERIDSQICWLGR